MYYGVMIHIWGVYEMVLTVGIDEYCGIVFDYTCLYGFVWLVLREC